MERERERERERAAADALLTDRTLYRPCAAQDMTILSRSRIFFLASFSSPSIPLSVASPKKEKEKKRFNLCTRFCDESPLGKRFSFYHQSRNFAFPYKKDSIFHQINCPPMVFPRIHRGEGRRFVPSLSSLRFYISASISFASLLGSLRLFRLWAILKGGERNGQRVMGKTMVTMVARQGRQLQRYTSCGRRLVVGCIPYKLKMDDPCTEDIDKVVQVLVISSQKGHGMMFPKGGWESDETMKQAASREAMEEAGVQGDVESNLGRWMYKSNRNNVFYEGIMFPLHVTEELAYWPEMEVRKRRWVTVAEAREGCQHVWMREALEKLLTRFERLNRQ